MGTPASQMKKRKVTISKRQKMQREILLAELRKNSVMTVACQKAGVSRSTVYRWMDNEPEFKNMIYEAISEGRETINDMAESVIIKKIRSEHLGAAKYYLSHNNDRYQPWRNRYSDSATHQEIKMLKEKLKGFFDSVFGKKK